ncbi:hypothetical protein NEF87_004344 [Candidatus Lokiarchaeum ossiferum]|uniref:Gfo/Idh/MocA-like oxidoreductase N-terminal domain-containing protein n=1 Tax=Candidatus Lokiarchaeum ossiferum TaxID=2951803 RepID=A0ABY6I026_9ARCH|nr:hypothetical protein NEF87_004344 [Candidatus Lokiarchaeum sp. B-35]
MKKNICVIGTGNLGSRHLQALKKINFPLKIHVVDPNQNSLKIAEQRYNSVEECEAKHTISYHNKIDFSDIDFEVAIIATNSDVRKMVIENLLAKNHVEKFVLEKVLFQKLEDYNYVENLLKTNKSEAWVNCPRRMFFVYKEIKDIIGGNKFSFSISGSKFNLMSNAIHFIDIIAFLTDSTEFVVDTSELIPKLSKSKRQGFYEMNGKLNIKFKNGTSGFLHCLPSGNLPLINEIYTDEKRIILKESELEILTYNPQISEKWIKKEIKFPYQSELTNILIEDLIKTNSCELTSYSDSKKLHLSIFKPVLDYINNFSDSKYEILPFS